MFVFIAVFLGLVVVVVVVIVGSKNLTLKFWQNWLSNVVVVFVLLLLLLLLLLIQISSLRMCSKLGKP